MRKRKWIWILIAVGVVVLGLFLYFPFWIDARFDDLKAELEEEIRAFEARDLSRPPILAEAVPGDAWGHYHEACVLHRKLEKEIGAGGAPLLEWRDLDSPIPDSLRDYALRCDPVLAAVARGANAAELGPIRDVRGGIDGLGGDWWEAAFGMALRPRAMIRAVLLAREGRAEEAVDLLLVLDRFGEDLEVAAGTAIDLMVGASLRSGAWATASDLVGAGLLPAEQSERLEKRAREELQRPWNGWDAIEGESLTMQSTLRLLSEGEAFDKNTRVTGVGRWFLYWAWDAYRARKKRFREERPAGTPEDLRAALAEAEEEGLGERISSAIAALLTQDVVLTYTARAREMELVQIEGFLLGRELLETGAIDSLDAERWEIRESAETGKPELWPRRSADWEGPVFRVR
jgi:hypothetical protein